MALRKWPIGCGPGSLSAWARERGPCAPGSPWKAAAARNACGRPCRSLAPRSSSSGNCSAPALTKTLDKSSNRISFALIIAALLVAQEGTVLGLFNLQSMGIFGYIIAAIIGAWLLVSIIRSGKL